MWRNQNLSVRYSILRRRFFSRLFTDKLDGGKSRGNLDGDKSARHVRRVTRGERVCSFSGQ